MNLSTPHNLDERDLCGARAARFAVAQSATPQPPHHLADAHFVAIRLDQILNG
jgi:hypothetical protein